MKKTGVFLIMAVVFLLFPTQSRAKLELGIGAWDQNIRGDLYYNLHATPDVADMERDLDLESDARVVAYLKCEMPILPNLYLGITPMKFEGTRTRNTSFTFGEYTFLGDRPLRSKMVLNHYDVGLYYSLKLPDLASMKAVKVDLGLNLRTAELDIDVTGSVATEDGERRVRESKDYTLPIPMLYGAVQITPVDKVSLEFEGRGVTLQGDHLFSFLGRIKFYVTKGFFVAAGYRFDYIRLDEDNLNIDSTVDGALFETGMTF